MEVRARSASAEPLGPTTEPDRWDELDALELELRDVTARLLECISAIDESWQDDPAVPDLPSELARRHGVSAWTAWERVRFARATREVPGLVQAHREGRLSWDQLRWLTKFVTPDTEPEWVERGSRMPPVLLREEAERQRRARREEVERDHASRSLSTHWDEDRRNLEIYARLDAEKGAAVEAALTGAAQRIEVEEGLVDPHGARLADALFELTTRGAGTSDPALVVHVDVDALEGETTGGQGRRVLAETATGVQLHRQTVRRLACGGRIRWALERDGRPIGLISTGRTVTVHQMELLRFRDRGCTFPGCGSTWYLHAHHIKHWADGGTTSLDNLTLLCGRHHRRLHEGRWTIRGRPPDDLSFLAPSGRTYDWVPELASTPALVASLVPPS